MCEINFMYALTSKVNERETQEIMQMAKRSFRNNPDGVGFFSETDLTKSLVLGKSLKIDKYVGSRFLINHCRLTSAGAKNLNNTQPIKIGNVVLVHNGHLTEYHDAKKDRSDTFVLAQKINQKYKETKDEIASIKACLDGMRWYSVFIYFRDTKRLFYVRDSMASFYFGLARRKGNFFLIGATKKHNLENIGTVSMFGFELKKNYKVLQVKEPESHLIYEINSEGLNETGVKIKDAFSQREIVRYDYQNDYYGQKLTDIWAKERD